MFYKNNKIYTDGNMNKNSKPLPKLFLGMAMVCCLSESGFAQEVIDAPTTSASPQAKPTQQAPENANVPHAFPDLAKVAEQVGAPPVSWNDTFIGYRVGHNFHFPGVPDKIKQDIGYLTTTGGFKYGSYAFNVDYRVSDSANPEAGGPSNGGAQEVYSVGRVTASTSKIFGKPIDFGVIRDFGLTGGYEFGTKNDAYAQRARMLVLGATVEFAMPRGFWNLTAGVRTESNHNGIVGVDVDYDTAWHIESSWLYPFRVGPVPLIFRGFATSTGPKGRDGFGVKTTTEYLARASLLADVGSFAGHPRTFYAGVGYEYWKNMFGTPSDEAENTKTSTPMLQIEAHF